MRTLTRESIVALVSSGNVDDRDPSDVRLAGTPLSISQRLCEGQRFREQEGAAFCSGTLIDDDLVLTAGHCIESLNDCLQTSFVFNHYLEGEDDPAQITTEDVYGCQELVVQRLAGTLDYAIVQLDRPVTFPHRPARVNLVDEALSRSEPVTVIGFGSGLPAKIDNGGRVVDPRASIRDYFSATTDTFGGNSGSGVFNADNELVGVLVRGETDYVFSGRCRVVNVLSDDIQFGGEDSVYALRAVDAMCDESWPSVLCDEGGTGSWCDPCAGESDCLAGWRCQTYSDNDDASYCAPTCLRQEDCRVDHACVEGVCRPAITASQCVEDDVWGVDVCGNVAVREQICGNDARCEDGRCEALGGSDLALDPEEVQVIPAVPEAGEPLTFFAVMRNLGEAAYERQVTVQFWLTDDAGERTLFEELAVNTSGGILPMQTVSVQASGQGRQEGTYLLEVILRPTAEDPENNNIASVEFVVPDNDTEGPVIEGVRFLDRGDEDGVLEEGEPVLMIWDVTDPSGVSSTSISIDGVQIAATGATEWTLDPRPAGVYEIALQATDGDNSPAAGPVRVEILEIVPSAGGAPAVLNVSPEADALEVPLTTTVSVRFDREMSPDFGADSFVLSDASGEVLPVTLTLDRTQTVVTATPSAQLSPGEVVQVTVERLQSAAGVVMSVPVEWRFTTAQSGGQPPQVALIEPADGAVVRGDVDVIGLVVAEGGVNYTLTYASAELPDEQQEIAATQSGQVVLGELGVWASTELGEGEFILRLEATDLLGQTSAVSNQVMVDNIGPTFGGWFQDPADLTVTHEGAFVIGVELVDGGTGVEQVELSYRVGAGEFGPFMTMLNVEEGVWGMLLEEPWSTYAGETVEWRVRARDNAGNVSVSAVQDELVDGAGDLPPVVGRVPDVRVEEGQPQGDALDLWSFVSDDLTPTSQLELTLSSMSPQLVVSLEQGRFVTVVPAAGFVGQGEVQVRVRDGSGQIGVGVFAIDVVADATPPNPDPAQWVRRPGLSGSGLVASMVAVTGADPNGVEYLFEEISGSSGGDSSGWQSTPIYSDSGLSEGLTYRYRVHLRDRSTNGNVGGWSEVVSVTVPGSCDLCDANSRRCDAAGGVSVCRVGANGCLDWSSQTPCPAGDRCEDGECVPNCADECSSAGLRECTGARDFRVCGDFDADTCLEWGVVTTCAAGDRCEAGSCVFECRNECQSAGSSECTDEFSYRVCGNVDGDPCLEWDQPTSCGDVEVCGSGGACELACVEDSLEPNGDGEAITLAAGGYPDLVVCPEDDDLYRVSLERGQELRVSLLFEHDEGDIQLELSQGGQPVDLSDGVDDGEEVRYTATEPVDLKWRVFVKGEKVNSYDMEVSNAQVLSDLCEEGRQECTDSTGYRVCEDLNADGFREWSPRIGCVPGAECAGEGECFGGEPDAGNVDFGVDVGVEEDVTTTPSPNTANYPPSEGWEYSSAGGRDEGCQVSALRGQPTSRELWHIMLWCGGLFWMMRRGQR